MDFTARGWARVIGGALAVTAFCIAAALSLDSLNFSVMSETARIRSIITDIALPIILAGPIAFLFLFKLRELAIANQERNTTLDAMAQGISCYDANQRLTIWNRRYAEMFGMDISSLRRGIPFGDVLELQRARGNFEGGAAKLQNSILDRVNVGVPFVNQNIMANGSVVSSTHMPSGDGGWVATHDDVTEDRARKALLSAQNIQLTAILGSMRQGACMFGPDGRLVLCNQQFAHLYGLPEEMTRPGQLHSSFERHLVEARLVDAASAARHLFRETAASHEQTVELLDGRFVRVVGSPMPDGGYVSTHEDVTEQSRVAARMQHDALHDFLTGLPNRRYLERELARREQQYSGTGMRLGMIHVDLDRFKQINDTLGHVAGDAMLRHASDVLRGCLEDGDFLARIGGDEFVILSAAAGRTTGFRILARRAISRMRKPVHFDGKDCRLGVSVGLAVEPGHDLDTRRLMVSADLALQTAKRAGGGRVEVYDKSMRLAVERKRRLTDEFILGLERGEFIAHYQIKVDARHHQVSGIEALVRWSHPERGLLQPADFLWIAEELDLVSKLDDMVLVQVIDQIARWRAFGLDVPVVSVNVSSRRIQDPALVKRLARLAIPKGAISFELLESIYLDDIDDTVAWNMDGLRDMGIGIEIDDFGTGRASLLALSKLRPDKLKIDRHFVAPIVGSPQQQQLVSWMIAIGRSLGVQIVAEGVEDMRQAEVLSSLGCDELQGFAFGRPITGDALVEVLQRAPIGLDAALG